MIEAGERMGIGEDYDDEEGDNPILDIYDIDLDTWKLDE